MPSLMVRKDGMILAPLLFHHIPKEQAITDDISSPHTLRLLHQSIEPFQTVLLPPDRGTLHGTSEEVKDSTDGNLRDNGCSTHSNESTSTSPA